MKTETENIEIKTWAKLASALGVSDRTIRTWKKLKDSPKKDETGHHDVAKWKTFISHQGLGTRSKGGADGTMLRDLRAKKLAEETKRIVIDTERLKVQAAVDRGELIKVDEFKRIMGGAWMEMINSLNQMNHRIAQQVVGLDSGAASKVIKAEIRECLRKFQLPRGLNGHPAWKQMAKEIAVMHSQLDKEGRKAK